MKAFLVSDLAPYAMAHSFARAMQGRGWEVETFDVAAATDRHVRLGRLGRYVHRFMPVEAWVRKGNRELALACRAFQPDLVMVFGSAPVTFGTLALIRSFSDARFVLYWPDPLFVLADTQLHGAPLYDCLATYSSATTGVFSTMGYRHPLWLPFAADVDLVGPPSGFDGPFEYDISFAGGWRPERETALHSIRRRFPRARMAIFGPNWRKFCKDRDLLSISAPSVFVGREYGDLIRRSRVTLNRIDDTNYPGANMRFFEVPAAGGLQLASSCPEMADAFIDREHLLYFAGDDQLADQVDWALSRPAEAAAMRRAGHERVLRGHRYSDRLDALCAHLGLK